MKIFRIKFTTKKDLRKKIDELKKELAEIRAELYEQEELLEAAYEAFPLVIGQTVFDLALKNKSGRFTKTKPSFEYSTITPVEVTEKNYFSLVNRFRNNDVFLTQEDAEEYLESVCK